MDRTIETLEGVIRIAKELEGSKPNYPRKKIEEVCSLLIGTFDIYSKKLGIDYDWRRMVNNMHSKDVKEIDASSAIIMIEIGLAYQDGLRERIFSGYSEKT